MTITASKFELAMRCPAAFALPHSDIRTAEADAGRDMHAEREERIGAGDIPEALQRLLPGAEWRAEVKFAYDVLTGEGREIGQGGDRDYGQVSPFEICGTADAVGRLGDQLVIVDWKSHDKVTAAAENPQLRTLALAASRAYGVSRAKVAIVHLTSGTDAADLDELDLDAFAVQARSTLLDVARMQHNMRNGLPVTFYTGRQCRYCPAFEACPKQRDLVALVRTDAMATQIEQRIPVAIDDDEAADLYGLWKRLGILHKRLGAALFARAGSRPIPLPDGKMFGRIESLGNEKLDGDTVYEVVKARHGQAIADTAVIRSATKTRLREALGFVGAKSVAAAEREVLDEVRARGGSKRERKESIEEYVPQLRAVNE